jgi:hypothetical protein
MGSGKREMNGPKLCRHSCFHGVNMCFVGFQKFAGTVFNVYGLPQIPRNTNAEYDKPPKERPFCFYNSIFYHIVLALFSVFFQHLSTLWCSSLKARITCEGTTNLRLPRINLRKLWTAYYAVTRATTTTHNCNMLPWKGHGLLGKTFALTGFKDIWEAITRVLVVMEPRAYFQWASPGGHLASYQRHPRERLLKWWHLEAWGLLIQIRGRIVTSWN